MILNYFKTAWRNLLRNRFYSIINIAGLTLGLTAGILILIWVQDELSFDRFHKNSDRIYSLQNRVGTGSSEQIWTITVAPIAEIAKRELPEVEDAVRVTYNGVYTLFKYGNKVFNEERTQFADPSLFKVFDFNLIQGNPAQPFSEQHSVVLTESVARRYFGNQNAIGKILKANNQANFVVSGVIRDLPRNSSVQGEMFLPLSLLFDHMYQGNANGRNRDNDFSQFSYDTFLLLRSDVDRAALADKLRNIHLSKKPDDTDLTYLLQPMNDKHLYQADGSDGGIGTVRMFGIISFLILVIACINYVNLSTARSMLRAKEVSMRKIVGADRIQLFFQFLIETTLIFIFASILSLVLVNTLIPLYNQVSNKELVLDLTNGSMWKMIALVLAGTLCTSSVYPALLLSSFEPLKAIKGKMAGGLSEATLRKSLVVVQFAVSIILIAGTFVIGSQMRYIRSKALGYNRDHVLSFYMRDMNSHYESVKAELLQQPGVKSVTRAGGNIINIGQQTGNNSWDGKQVGETMMMRPLAVDRDFVSFFGIKMAAGTNFTGSAADSTHYILNEAAVKASRIKDPIGKKFTLYGKEGTIIGVVKDFHLASMRHRIEPSIFYFFPPQADRLYIKSSGGDISHVISHIQKSWKEYNGDYTFYYSFLDEDFANLYQSEEQSAELFTIFAGIAVLISCLGLFGLAAYTAQIRTREIGVRKVLGSTTSGIVTLLAKDFVRPVFISIFISVPVAWYAMSRWLQNFEYRIAVPYHIFIIAGALAFVIALLTISFQSIRAALADPVKSLRSE